MEQSYPVILSLDENGSIIAEFPDVPEAITMGADENEALEWARDALVVALTGYIDERRDIPRPSAPESGQKQVHLTPKIYPALRNSGPKWT
jgi:antitoxin HicB